MARHLTTSAVELSLVVEEALMRGSYRVGDFMVRNPVCAHLWQPLSFMRQNMLVNWFTYLPVAIGDGEKVEWRFVSDFQIARYLRADGDTPKDRLIQSLQKAIDSNNIELLPASTCSPEEIVTEVLRSSEGFPALVLSTDGKLVGILTAFDLL